MYISGKKAIIITSKHGTKIFFPITILFQENFKKKCPERSSKIQTKCARAPWASYNTPKIESVIQYGRRIGKKVYYHAALATLRKTEQTLSKDKQWVETYQRQMEDMLDRGVARMPSEEELQKLSGLLFYISHLAVVNPKSNSTPVRIVFNSSQVYVGTSLNSCLAKGSVLYE